MADKEKLRMALLAMCNALHQQEPSECYRIIEEALESLGISTEDSQDVMRSEQIRDSDVVCCMTPEND